jgi:hypothetical protein
MIHGSWLPATLVHKCTTSPRELLELTGAFSRCVIVAVRAVTILAQSTASQYSGQFMLKTLWRTTEFVSACVSSEVPIRTVCL